MYMRGIALEPYKHDTQSSYFTTVYLTVSAPEPHKNDAAPHSVHGPIVLLYNLDSLRLEPDRDTALLPDYTFKISFL
jgi:hypothetical protein